MLLCYVLIIVKLTIKHRRQMKANEDAKIEMITKGTVRPNPNRIQLRNSGNNNHLERARRRMVSMTACFVITYICCSTPYHISIAIEAYSTSSDQQDEDSVHKSKALLIMNEVLNLFQMASVIA